MLDDHQLGKLLVQAGKLTEQALKAALAEQKQLVAEGRASSRLGDLLVSQGLVRPSDIQDVLARQGKSVGVCESCGARFNVVAWVPHRTYRCGKCRGVLKPAPEGGVRVEGTNVMPSISGTGPGELAKLVEEAKKKDGKRLGKFLLVRELGRGGMGVVYLGYEEELRRTVAVKVLLSSGDDKLEARFLREARLISRLRHPNIVGVHELGVDVERAYFTMDFVEGGPLNALFAPKRIPVRELMDILRKVARALDYAHRQGLVHRDIKPQNILVAADGTPFLSDFGLAREVESNTRLTMSGAIMGTPAYMSPEQARGSGSESDGRTDLYSLGAVLYEGLTGRCPHEGPDLMAILQAVLDRDPAPPSAFAADVPRDVETICLKALAKAPEKRYQTGEEMALDIDRFLAGESIAARRAGNLEKGATWLRRRPAVAVGATSVLLVVLVAGALSWRASAREKERSRQSEEERKALAARNEETLAKLAELQLQLDKAKSPEEVARLLNEMKALGGNAAQPEPDKPEKTPDPVEPAAPTAWEKTEEAVASCLSTGDFGGAIGALHEFRPGTEEERGVLEKRLLEITGNAEREFGRIGGEAREAAEGGDSAGAIDRWKVATRMGIPKYRESAESEIAALEAAIRDAEREKLLSEVAGVRWSAFEAAVAWDGTKAGQVVEEAIAKFPAIAEDLGPLREICAAFDEFHRKAYEALAGEGTEITTYQSGGESLKVRSVGEDGKIKALHPQGAEIGVEYFNITPECLVALARKAGASSEAVGMFWFHYSHEKLGKDLATWFPHHEKYAGKARDLAPKFQNAAPFTGYMDAIDAAIAVILAGGSDPGTAEDPPVERDMFAVPAEHPQDSLWDHRRYDFSARGQLADWMAAPRDHLTARLGWGVRLEKGGLWVRNATFGWKAALGVQGMLRAKMRIAEHPMGVCGITYRGYELVLADGIRVSFRTADGSPLTDKVLPRRVEGDAFMFELRMVGDGNVTALFNGEELSTNSMDGRRDGPIGVLAERDTEVLVLEAEAAGVVPSDWKESYLAWLAYLERAGGDFPFAAATPLTDGRAMGAFESRGEGTWIHAGGAIRGKSTGAEPRAAAEIVGPGHRNFRLKFRYLLHSGRIASVTARLGPHQLEWYLPCDETGRWRDVELVVIERCAAAGVDQDLRLFNLDSTDEPVEGGIAIRLQESEVSFRDFVLEEVTGIGEDGGPGSPWLPMPGVRGGPDKPGVGLRPGAESLFDGKSVENFKKRDKLFVKAGHLVVGEMVETVQGWTDVEIDGDFVTDTNVKLQVGIRGEWVAKTNLSRGKHRLFVRAGGPGVEVSIDDKPLKIETTPAADAGGPFKLKVDGGVIRISALRARMPPK
ncbi:MAG: protein kinase [Planctomycetes bacterium]|nr:protein kinase [Planctomycetota bacterium]